jgi:hypothetical protein
MVSASGYVGAVWVLFIGDQCKECAGPVWLFQAKDIVRMIAI